MRKEKRMEYPMSERDERLNAKRERMNEGPVHKIFFMVMVPYSLVFSFSSTLSLTGILF